MAREISRCPYCLKLIEDQRVHLKANRRSCGANHAKKLLGDLAAIEQKATARRRART